jgi:NADH dehydrogenase FAD-containing subunit
MGEPAQARPVVAVLGGGYAGVNVAKSLDDVASVLLIEPKEAFVHNVAALRALVAPSWLPRIYLPYAGLLSHGRVIRDRAVKVDGGRVELASGEVIQADYVVLATGSAYPFPAKSDLDSTAAAHDRTLAAHAALAAAGRVLLLGAGPVGVELAGEITATWPDKDVTLVDPAGDILGARFRPELKAEIRRQLGELGVRVLLGTQLAGGPPGEPGELGTFTVQTGSGVELTADIWFRCYGVRPVSDYLAGSLAGARRPDGRVEVAPSLQVIGQGRVFALGDVAAADHPMAGAAARQAAVVAGNIRAFITGQGELAEYQAPPPGIVVPLGPHGGAGQRGGQDALLPAEVVADLKGRDLMVDRYIDLLGVPVSGAAVSTDGTPG